MLTPLNPIKICVLCILCMFADTFNVNVIFWWWEQHEWWRSCLQRTCGMMTNYWYFIWPRRKYGYLILVCMKTENREYLHARWGILDYSRLSSYTENMKLCKNQLLDIWGPHYSPQCVNSKLIHFWLIPSAEQEKKII